MNPTDTFSNLNSHFDSRVGTGNFRTSVSGKEKKDELKRGNKVLSKINGQNTEKCPRDLRRLSVIQTSVKNHQLKLTGQLSRSK